MRGKLLSYYHNRFTAKDHPAHAGKTPRSASRTLGGRESPRACGENFGSKLGVGGDKGLPSRVRGKLEIPRRAHPRPGITPACAGKTDVVSPSRACARDHPRVCGENRPRPDAGQGREGSPPRVRGKPTTTRRGARPRGITPACAGKTSYGIRSVSFNRDHPRVCGENLRPPMSAPARIGSPPRVRGKQAESFTGITLSRITPACAGKTFHITQKVKVL